MTADTVAQIAEKLRRASAAYYNEDPLMTDAQYDALRDHLETIAPEHPLLAETGASPSGRHFRKVVHELPMRSLNKVQSAEDFYRWASQFPPETEYLLQPKYDGISVEMHYEYGVLTRASTRGDGFTGEDITENVRRMERIPDGRTMLSRLPLLVLRGEIVMLRSVFASEFKPRGYSNPRNLAAGLSKRIDGEGCQFLSTMLFGVASPALPWREVVGSLCADGYWHLVSPYRVATGADAAAHQFECFVAERDSYAFDTDGVVVRALDDVLFNEAGLLNERPRAAVAWKYAHESAQARSGTALVTVSRRNDVIPYIESVDETPGGSPETLHVVWQTGSTGQVTPVIHLNDPVVLAGASISKASASSYGRLCDLLWLDPKEERGVPACPSCGGRLTLSASDRHLQCPAATTCPAQSLGRVERWLKSTGVLGAGPEVLAALQDAWGSQFGIPLLYLLDEADLAGLLINGRRFGESRAASLKRELAEKSVMPLHVFLGSLSVPGWGKRMFRKLCDGLGVKSYRQFIDVLEQYVGGPPDVMGIGELNWAALYQHFPAVQAAKLLGHWVRIEPPRKATGHLAGETFCFTGFRNPDLQAALEEAGADVASSVTGAVTILVTKDPTASTAKLQKARAAGVQIISIQEAEGLIIIP